MFAGSLTSTSVRVVVEPPTKYGEERMEAGALATSGEMPIGIRVWPEMTITRLPRRRSWAPYPPPDPRSSEPSSFGAAPPAAIARSLPWAIAKIVEPSVLARSGSSTPCSWSFVVEYAGEEVEPPPSLAAAAAAGATVPTTPVRVEGELVVASATIGGSG